MRSPGSSIDYVHPYNPPESVGHLKSWNRCGQAAIATVLDYHGLDPFGIERSEYDPIDGERHWDYEEVVRRIASRYPPNKTLGLFGTTPEQIVDALEGFGFKAEFMNRQGIPTEIGEIYERLKSEVASGLPVIVAVDRAKLQKVKLGPIKLPVMFHWVVVYGISDSRVHLANIRNQTVFPEEQFQRALDVRYWPLWWVKEYDHAAVFSYL